MFNYWFLFLFWQEQVSYFLFEGVISPTNPILIGGEEAQHLLQSRRIRKGEEVLIQDQQSQRYICEILEVGRRDVRLLPLQAVATPAEPKAEVWLCLAMVKEKALDFTLQKATELGATGILLFESQYSQRLPKGPELETKRERWQRILWEAAKQSERLAIPQLLLEAQPDWQSLPGLTLALHTQGTRHGLSEFLLAGSRVNLVIGPEGGFAEEEMAQFPALALGPRVLRAETAALAALALCRYLLGDLGA